MEILSKDPLIESFKIFGLHGYKDIDIDFRSPVKIVIAENGAGKTTILSALNAFLKFDFVRLRRIDFERIECRFFGHDEIVSISKSDLDLEGDAGLPDVYEGLAKIDDVTESDLFRLATEFSPDSDFDEIRAHPVAHKIFIESPWDWNEVTERIRRMIGGYRDRISPNLLNAKDLIGMHLKDVDVLYFPTYRRIEEPMVKGRIRQTPKSRYMRRRMGGRTSFSDVSTINYGLEDVESRLKLLSEEIQRRTSFGYRKISEQIIDDLLLNKFDFNESSSESWPEYEDLRRFFSRIHGGSSKAASAIDKIKKIYEGEDMYGSANPLAYFVSQLSKVVDQTSKLESAIETFVDRVNTYLSTASDPKEMVYDSTDMEVVVTSSWSEASLSLNQLSSGEKQVISLLAYNYLSEKKKIVLIDEPELSLSIGWQQKILPDVLLSGTCSQLLSITHSPFIFDNELDECGEPLSIRRAHK